MWTRVRLIALIAFIGLLPSCKTTFGELMDHQSAGDEAYRQANYPKAEEEYKAAINEAEKLGSQNVMVLISLRSLAQVYIAQNRTAEAEAIYQKRISLAEKSLQPDPAYQVTLYDDLATFYILENRTSDAKPVYERAILLTESTYGADDLNVAGKLNYYASLLKAKNQNVAAAEMEGQAARIRERVKKKTNPKK